MGDEEEDIALDKLRTVLPKILKHTLRFYRLTDVAKPARPFLHTELAKEKAKGFVSYSVFNANLTQHPSKINHIYIMGLLQNAALVRKLLPGWKTLFYIDCSSYTTYPVFYKSYLSLILKHFSTTSIILLVDFRTELPASHTKSLGRYAEVAKGPGGWDLALLAREMRLKGNLPLQYPKTVWRFLPAAYPVAFASRDADARLSAREAIALDAWMHSTYTIHRIFDNVGHTNPFLAGMWGAKPVCHNLVGDFAHYGSCTKEESVAVPGIEDMMLKFLSDRTILLKGYGVDELLMAEIDDAVEKTNYTTVATYGGGSYYAGASGIASLLEGRPRLKLGMRLMTLLPAQGPDTLDGSHQSMASFKRIKGGGVYGTDCYFVGEDLPLSSSADSGFAPWIRSMTVNYEKASPSDMTPAALKKAFKRFSIRKNPAKFAKDVVRLSTRDFKASYHFDKRILPQFWYTLLRGVTGDIPFYESEGSFNTNDYELTVVEKAMRHAFLKHRKMWPLLLTDVGIDIYDEKIGDLASWMANRPSQKTRPFKFKKVDYAPFYRSVSEEVYKHSKILSGLEIEDQEEYWEALLSLYPFTALRKWSFDF